MNHQKYYSGFDLYLPYCLNSFETIELEGSSKGIEKEALDDNLGTREG